MRYLAVVIVLVSALRAQGGDGLLDDAMKRFEGWRSHRDIVGVAEAERALHRLRGLIDAPDAVRERACAFLESVVTSPAPQPEVYRSRVAAVGLIGVLAVERPWAEFLIKVARGRRPELRGLDFWVERALGELRGKTHAEHLASLLDDENDARVRLALGGLARMKRAAQRPVLLAALPRLLERTRDDDPELRSRAVLALSLVAGEGASVPALFAAARDESPVVRLAAARACARLGRRPGVEPVIGRLLEDAIALVREEAVIAYRACGHRETAGTLIRRLDKEPLRIRIAIAETLKELTGETLPPEYGPWKDWLGAEEKPPGVGDGSYARPRYYDVPVESDRILFILDVSMSMGYALHQNTKSISRLAGAKRELVRVISALDDRSRFNIMTFSTAIGTWRKTLQRATEKIRKSGAAHVRRLGHAGKTNSHGALAEAFERFPDIDTIFFVTDGIPTVGKTTVQEHIIERVAHWNRLRGVRIHTIAAMPAEPDPPVGQYTPNHDAIRFMRILAAETGGTFTRVR